LEKNKYLRPCFSWFGGKIFLIKHLLPRIPEHAVYVEGFGGSGALLFAKSPATVEVYNDLDSGLVHFYRVLRDPELSKQLAYALTLTPYSREEFFHAKENWPAEEDPVERARMWFTVARNAFASSFETGGWRRSTGATARGMAHVVSAYWSSIEMFPELTQRLQGVQIENVSYDQLIRNYDSPNTFFYFDPPYVLSTRTGGKQYKHEMTLEDHNDFIRNCLSIKGKVLISGYDHEIYKPLTDNGWRRDEIEVATTAGLSKPLALQQRLTGEKVYGNSEKRTEVLWMNYE
jgi:DNA adenine methylase